MAYDAIELEIIKELNGFVPIAMQNKFTDPEWTISIQAIFSKLGHRENCRVAASKKEVGRGFEEIRQLVAGDNPDHSEWLYDILWWHEVPPDHMTEVPLVAESEWGNRNAFKFDFQKLPLAKAAHKIMIFQCDDSVITWAKEQIKRFKDTQGERYLFCSWHGKGVDKFKYELFIAP